jgi:hypothetical protein
MRRDLGPEAAAKFEEAVAEAVRDSKRQVAYADASEVTPSGSRPPSWWKGEEEAAELAMGWVRAQSVDGVMT